MGEVDERQVGSKRASTCLAASAIHFVESIDAAGPQNLNSGNWPSSACSAVAQVAGLRVAVGDLAAVGRVHRPRRHRHVGRRVHREPPAEVRAGDARRRLPDLRRLHEPVRLLPQPHLHRVPEQPAVADRAVPARQLPGQVGALHGRGHGGRDAAERRHRAGVGERLQARRRRPEQVGRQRHGAQDDGLLSQFRSPRSWSGERS